MRTPTVIHGRPTGLGLRVRASVDLLLASDVVVDAEWRAKLAAS